MKVAIVAALHREVSSLVKDWRVSEKQYAGRAFRFFEGNNVVLVCGGIGSDAARRAAEAVVALYEPELIYSAGFAGATTAGLRVGEVVVPRRVVDARDGSSIDTGMGEGTLVTFAAVARSQQKQRLHASFAATAVDMEAAAVAKAAECRGVRFAAVKAISDASDFEMPSLEKFVAADGSFLIAQFSFFVILRPWMWARVLQLRNNSALASGALCAKLRDLAAQAQSSPVNDWETLIPSR